MPGPQDDPDKLPASIQLAKLARRDRRLDIGCGAALGLGIALLFLLTMQPVGWPVAAGFLLLAAAVCGLLGRRYGERFFDKVVDVLRWWW